MLNTDYLEAAARQCESVNSLIIEAANSQDPENTRHLYALARDETNNLSNSLYHYLSRIHPGHELSAA